MSRSFTLLATVPSEMILQEHVLWTKGTFFPSLIRYLYSSVHINYARALPIVLFSAVLPLWSSLYHSSCGVISLNYMAGDCGKALENTFAPGLVTGLVAKWMRL